jgi:aminoglycoside phosphotransferase (APT) family kinase protein
MITNVTQGAESLLDFIQPSGGNKPRIESTVLEQSVYGRLVVLYALYHADGPEGSDPYQTLIGKFYKDRMGHHTFQTMGELCDVLSQHTLHAPFAAPRALFYDPHLRFLAQERVDGVPFKELVDRADFDRYLRRAGSALAGLHSLKLATGRTTSVLHHLSDLMHPHPFELAEQLPEFRGLVEEIMQALFKLEDGWKHEVECSPIHRDFHLRQLFYGDDRVWIIDWDLFAKGDPALDIGNLLVYLKTHLAYNDFRSIENVLEGYFASGASAILKRIPLYEALTYLRLACKRFQLKPPRWKDRVRNMLYSSQQCLSGQSLSEKVSRVSHGS